MQNNNYTPYSFTPMGASAAQPDAPAAATTQQQPTPQPTSDSGSGLLGFIPTAGSILGSIAGTALDPFTFGLGTVAGGAIGDALGKAVEDSAQGKSINGADLLTAAGEGGIGAGVGGLLGKIGGGVVSSIAPKLASGAGSKVAAQFGKNISSDDATQLANYGLFSPKDVQGATEITNKAIGTHLPNILDQNQAALEEAGQSGAQDLAPFFSGSTAGKPTQTIQEIANQAGFGADPVKVANFQKRVDSLFLTPEANAAEAKTIANAKGGKGVIGLPNGNLQNQLPSDTLNITKKLDKIVYGDNSKNLKGLVNSQSIDDQNMGSAFQTLSNTMKQRLYGEESPIGSMAVTNAQKQDVINEIAPLKDLYPKYYEAKVDQINNAKTIGELRNTFAFDANVSGAANKSLNAAQFGNGTTTAQTLRTGLPFLSPHSAPVGTLSAIAAHPAIDSTVAKGLSSASNFASNPAVQKMIPVLSRIGALTATNLPNFSGAPVPVDSTVTNPQGGQPSGEPAVDQNSPYSQYVNALMTLGTLAPGTFGSEASSVLGSMGPQLQTNEALKNSIGSLEQSFAGAGGGQGVAGVGSLLSSFFPGTEANAYNQQKEALAAQLATTLGITPQAAMAYLPSFLQSQPTAANRLGVLQSIGSGLPG